MNWSTWWNICKACGKIIYADRGPDETQPKPLGRIERRDQPACLSDLLARG